MGRSTDIEDHSLNGMQALRLVERHETAKIDVHDELTNEVTN